MPIIRPIESQILRSFRTFAADAFKDVNFLAGKISRNNETKATLRNLGSAIRDGDIVSPSSRKPTTLFGSELKKGLKSLEGQDKLGNFEIQALMSAYNQAETLASSVRKKQDDTSSSVIGKI